MDDMPQPSHETVKNVFTSVKQRLTSLQSYFNMKPQLRDDIIHTLLEEMSAIEKSFLRDWHSTEAYQRIIQEYEDYFQTFGFNSSAIEKKIKEDQEIQFHLNEATKYHNEIEKNSRV